MKKAVEPRRREDAKGYFILLDRIDMILQDIFPLP